MSESNQEKATQYGGFARSPRNHVFDGALYVRLNPRMKRSVKMDTSDHADIAELRSATEEFLQLSDTKAALSNLVSRLNESKRPTHFRTGGSKLEPCPSCGQLVAEDEKESHVCDPVSIAMMQSSKPEYALRQRAEAARASPQWVPDDDSPECMLCGKGFGFFEQRHHCRSCGWAVCGSCAGTSRQLERWLDPKEPHALQEEPSAKPLRVCTLCSEALEAGVSRAAESVANGAAHVASTSAGIGKVAGVTAAVGATGVAGAVPALAALGPIGVRSHAIASGAWAPLPR